MESLQKQNHRFKQKTCYFTELALILVVFRLFGSHVLTGLGFGCPKPGKSCFGRYLLPKTGKNLIYFMMLHLGDEYLIYKKTTHYTFKKKLLFLSIPSRSTFKV